jgi:hypothetical protein
MGTEVVRETSIFNQLIRLIGREDCISDYTPLQYFYKDCIQSIQQVTSSQLSV